uniref:Retrotransposon gag domain-containing protein n=1 Tax=Tanacetum cinerariifolium TaxID=118510 RepID=A0A6L2LHU2_TANCI|nr:hypothetical protein [Tanacetum cinerariifolium]
MAKTMEQYMRKTRVDYGLGIARPKIEDKNSFELKGHILKELRDNTFSVSNHEDANEHIKKVLEIVDLFHIPNITIDQVMLRAFPMSLTGAASYWLKNKPSGSITTWEDLEIKFLSKYCPPACTTKKLEEINNFQQELDENLYQAWERFKELLMKCPQHYLTEMQEVVLFYNGLDVPTRQILDSRGALPSKTVADAKSTETSDGLAAIQAQLNNLGREIKKVNEKVYAAQVGCEQCKGLHYTKDCPLKEEEKTVEQAYYSQYSAPFQGGGYKATALEFYQRNNANPSNQGASIKTLEIKIGKMNKVIQERGFRSLPCSTETNMRDHLKSISTIVKADSYPIHRIGSSQYVVSTGQDRTLMYKTKHATITFPSHLNGYYCEEKKESYGLQFSEAYSKASHINNSISRKEKDPGSFTLPCFINNVFVDNALADLGASISVMPLSTYLNLGLRKLAHTKLTVKLPDTTVKYPKEIAKNVLVGIGKFDFLIDFIILDIPEDIKVPLIFGRPFLSTAHAKIHVFKRKIILRVGEERIIFKSVKLSSSLEGLHAKLKRKNGT